MRILMLLLNVGFPPDERVMQEAKSLMDAGFEVRMITALRPGEKAEEDIDGMHVYRVKRYPIYIFEVLVKKKAREIYAKWPYDVVHKHDLPMSARTVLGLKRRHGVKVVWDLHENWTGMMEATIDNITTYQRWIINGLKREEKKVLCAADSVIVVAREHKKRLETICPGSSKKMYEVSNYAHTKNIDRSLEAAENEVKSGSAPENVTSALDFIHGHGNVLIYFDGLGRHRGVETVLEAMKHMPEDAAFLIAGGNPERAYDQELRERVKELGLSERVHITGRIPFRFGMYLIQHCGIAVVPYASNSQTNNTIPHKIFQYMYLDKPILASDVAPLKRVLGDAKCGLVFQAGNPKDFAAKYRELIAGDLKILGEAGRASVQDRYNWSVSERELIRLYKRLGT